MEDENEDELDVWRWYRSVLAYMGINSRASQGRPYEAREWYTRDHRLIGEYSVADGLQKLARIAAGDETIDHGEKTAEDHLRSALYVAAGAMMFLGQETKNGNAFRVAMRLRQEAAKPHNH
jgi:hypothetical protein